MKIDKGFRLAVEAAPNAMVVADAAGRIVLANRRAADLFGYDRDELLDQLIEVLIPEESRAAHPVARKGFMAAPSERSMGAGRELFALHKGGRRIPVEIGLNPFETTEGTFVLSAIVDITERRRVEQEREELLAREQAALKEARAANQAKDNFLAVLSHELRTPLNAIIGWVQQLRDGVLDAPDATYALEVIERNARLQTRLVSDLLDVSRILQGKLRLDVGACDPVAILEGAIAAIRPAAIARKIRLRSILETAPAVLGDHDRLHQILWNLLSNAVKFTPMGGSVEVQLESHESHVRISVRDDGCGIPSEQLSRVFDRFFQADSSTTRHHGGLGIGLSLARELVEMHGGWIQAESAGEGHGTIVTVSLPASRAEEIGLAQAHAREVPSPASPANALAGLRVLVVDDEQDTRDLLLSTLRRFGAETLGAGSVAEAMATMETWQPDVVLSDIEMPGEDGYALLARLRSRGDGWARQIPALAVTAYAGSEHKDRILKAGFRFHVEKPIDIRKLVVLIAGMRSAEDTAADR